MITKGGWFVIKTREVWKSRHWTDLIIKPPNIFMKMGRILHQSPERYHDHKKLRIAIKKMSFLYYDTWRMVYIFTVRNEVAKVMFLHVSVILFTGGLVVSQHTLQVVSQHALQQGGVLSQHALQVVSQHALQQGDTCSWGGACWGVCSQGVCGDPSATPPPKADGYCCGRYA